MTIEINIQDYSGPAELATAIRESIGQLYVDDVRVQCGKAAHRVTPNTADAVCRGLLIAAALNESNAKVTGNPPEAACHAGMSVI